MVSHLSRDFGSLRNHNINYRDPYSITLHLVRNQIINLSSLNVLHFWFHRLNRLAFFSSEIVSEKNLFLWTPWLHVREKQTQNTKAHSTFFRSVSNPWPLGSNCWTHYATSTALLLWTTYIWYTFLYMIYILILSSHVCLSPKWHIFTSQLHELKLCMQFSLLPYVLYERSI
jgi:hypothetical protein